MKRLRSAALVLLLTVASAFPAMASVEGSKEQPFAPGGRVWMDLSAGDYTIKAGSDERIVVRWTARDPDAHNVRVEIAVRGREATIVTRGDTNECRLVIELPAQSDVTTRLTAGELRMRGIVGNKDVSSWAGNVDIEVGRRDDYKSASARVTAGELSARTFDASKNGLFRSFSWKGPGRYSLDVRLTAGNITLE
ncbi:MAG TPA: hypothetical protein VGK32_17700 [Vicinamibacterales bacterium]